MPRNKRFTIYDALEEKGYFDSNPANTFSRSPVDQSSLYKGPVEYPKMLYHPQGEEKVIVPAELITTPFGPKAVGEQRELIYQIVDGPVEHRALEAEGWHNHPAKAVRARVEAYIAGNPEMSELEKAKLMKSLPAIASVDRIRQLEAELAKLTAEKAAEGEGSEMIEAGAPVLAKRQAS